MCRATTHPIIVNNVEQIASLMRDTIFSPSITKCEINNSLINKDDIKKSRSSRTIFNDYWLNNSRSSARSRYIDCRNMKNLNQYKIIPIQSNVKKVRFNPLIIIFEFQTQ